MLSPAVNAIVCQHLAKVASEIAAEFRSSHNCDPNQNNVSLKDLVSSYHSNIFANSLVYKHLCKVSPNLVEDFKLLHTVCEESLDNLVFNEKVNSRKRKRNDFSDRRNHMKKVGNTIGEESEDDVVVLYEKINIRDAPGERTIDRKVKVVENLEMVGKEDVVDEKFLKELEKYHPCFDIAESELDILEGHITASTQSKQSDNLKCSKTAQTSKRKLLTLSVLSEEDINGFCDILDCEEYKGLQQRLTNDNDLDKLASYILSKNIPVRKIHKFLFTTSSQLSKYIGEDIRTHEKFKVGYFNPEENSIIQTNWNKLLEVTNLQDMDKVFSKSSNLSSDGALKFNVIGLYLSLGMSKTRYTSDVFEQARKILVNKLRKLTSEDKNFMVKYVDEQGEKCDWKELGYILYKKYPKNIVRSLKKIYKRTCFATKLQNKKGTVTIEEDKIILDFMFSGSNSILANSENFIEPSDSYKILAKQLGRSELSVYRHWHSVLKPTLLQYHAGTLQLDVIRLFMNYLNEKGAIYLQDIQWPEVFHQTQFAGHTRDSLTLAFNGVRSRISKSKKCKTIEITVPEMAQFVNDRHKPGNKNCKNDLNGKKAKRKEEIIKYYKALTKPMTRQK